ncbi:ricin B lectin domain-containing protein [Flagelloscypha sp. PMI_526]|nr:ricin B lectin domain-containing protein [Flagelloscypha sp. PMI_526]
MRTFLSVCLAATYLSLASGLFACSNVIYTENQNRYGLVSAAVTGPLFQCDYIFDYDQSTQSCFYSVADQSLAAVNSSTACPNPIPNAADAGSFYIEVPHSGDGLGNCITSTNTNDGSKVIVSGCDGRHGFPNQKWVFDGDHLKQVDSELCLDVTDGKNEDGTKLQAWTCFAENTNQQFVHAGGAFLRFPLDRLQWQATDKCVDLTDGSTTAGNQLQVWECNDQNTNQNWKLGITYA